MKLLSEKQYRQAKKDSYNNGYEEGVAARFEDLIESAPEVSQVTFDELCRYLAERNIEIIGIGYGHGVQVRTRG